MKARIPQLPTNLSTYLHRLTKLELLIIGSKRKAALWLLMNVQKLSRILIDNSTAVDRSSHLELIYMYIC